MAKLWSVGWGPTVFGASWHFRYLSSTIRYLPKASRIPPSDPSAGACLSLRYSL
ncbi:hypothetical protein HETIRDRAFT_422603 [Heterobasidion irregulare TC 32-1]|uniref:Uncharacterized protein n=1 Tax=Heterobasidion irregulare (strain TC 32-1) TaxID=747525 RepID=W4JR99_HETIT|nr:uncharacterized protein HETIRDRAFT_422603 [Heterobasidion irregulare TC 32-1]ETW75989.1 hypothetical protein HETIRDRAFT_422603 [Heterobasidion irregulare TC 32-1]